MLLLYYKKKKINGIILFSGIAKDGPFIGMSVMTTPFKKVLGIMPKGKERWQRLEITKTDKEAYDMTKICIGSGFNIRCKWYYSRTSN